MHFNFTTKDDWKDFYNPQDEVEKPDEIEKEEQMNSDQFIENYMDEVEQEPTFVETRSNKDLEEIEHTNPWSDVELELTRSFINDWAEQYQHDEEI